MFKKIGSVIPSLGIRESERNIYQAGDNAVSVDIIIIFCVENYMRINHNDATRLLFKYNKRVYELLKRRPVTVMASQITGNFIILLFVKLFVQAYIKENTKAPR